MNPNLARILAVALLAHAPSAFAYIGPGLGTGAAAAILGIAAALVLLVVGVVWYPIKRMLGKKNDTDGAEGFDDEEA